MPRGASSKRERAYQKLKNRFEKSGRHQGRAEEVAARIVNKQRRKFGETKLAKRREEEGRSPDRHLPIGNYRHLTISQLRSKIRKLSTPQLKKVERFEKEHKGRKGVIELIKNRLRAV